jgi:hypothetical protein
MIHLFAMPSDRARADAVVDALVADDLDIWGETAIPGGTDWPAAMRRAIAARCLIFCWSAAALADTPEAAAFRRFARDACMQGKAIGVLFEAVTPPGGFDCTLYSLTEWRAAPSGWRKWLIGDAYVRDIVAAARSKQANRDPAPPSAQRKLLFRQLAVIFSVIILPAIAVITAPSALLDYYDRIAAMPSAAEQQDWDALPPGDCKALKAFIHAYPNGAFRDTADALIGAARVSNRTEWGERLLDDEIYLPHVETTKADAARAAEAEGARRCAALVQGTGAKLTGSTTEQLRQNCEQIDGVQHCDWRGTVRCAIAEPHTVTTEFCGHD